MKETPQHLDLIDGLMEDILHQKWNAFAKKRFASIPTLSRA